MSFLFNSYIQPNSPPLSTLPPTTPVPALSESNHRESVADFVRWALAQLKLNVSEEQGVLRLQLPEADQADFEGLSELNLQLAGTPQDATCEASGLDSRFGRWLLAHLQALGPAAPTRPARQPVAVNDITDRLFAAYQVDGGGVHLGGCQLDDYPFLRLTYVEKETGKESGKEAGKEAGNESVRHIFVAHDGSAVSDQLANDLGLREVEPILHLPPRIDDDVLQSLIAVGRQVATQSSPSRDFKATPVEPVATSLVWVKNASGQLDFEIGDTTVSLPFSGWARLLQAKSYTSPQTGASSFHLAATDDGRIDVFEQIAPCEQSGRRVLQQELVTCSVTGKQVLEEFTETCPVTGQPCLTEEFATCPTCQQKVSKLALEGAREAGKACTACRQLTKIKKDDPRLVWIFGEHPALDRWNHWQLSETKNVYIGQAKGWTKRLLVVVDKETLAVQHLATAGKFSSVWVPVSGIAQKEVLR